MLTLQHPPLLAAAILALALAACSPQRDAFSFTITPAEGTNLPRGESGAYQIDVDRSEGFDGEILFSLVGAPEGITGSGAVEAGEGIGELIVTAAADAPLGAAEFTVVGSPADGALDVEPQEQGMSLNVIEAIEPQ